MFDMWQLSIIISFCLTNVLAGVFEEINKRTNRFPEPYGPSLFAPFGEGAFDAYADVPVLPPFGYPFPGPFPSAFAGPGLGPFPGPLPGSLPGAVGGPIPGPLAGAFPGHFPGPLQGALVGPIPGSFSSPFPGAYPFPLIAPPPALPSPYYFSQGSPPAASSQPAIPSPLAPSTTGPVIVSAKTAATLSLASIIHALIAKKFYPPIFPFPVPNPLPYAVPIRVPFPLPPTRYPPFGASRFDNKIVRYYGNSNVGPSKITEDKIPIEKFPTKSKSIYSDVNIDDDWKAKNRERPVRIPLHEPILKLEHNENRILGPLNEFNESNKQ